MMNLKIGDKELKIKYGYKPTLKERVISKIVKFSNSMNAEKEDDEMEAIEDLLLYLPELLLVGLQVHHEEYRYNYDTKEGKDEQLNKMFDLVDEYASGENADIMQLFNDLQDEMKTDSFLASLFQKEQNKLEAVEEATQTAEN